MDDLLPLKDFQPVSIKVVVQKNCFLEKSFLMILRIEMILSVVSYDKRNITFYGEN